MEAKKNRLRRRLNDAVGELIGAIGILFSIAALCFLFIFAYSYLVSSRYFEIKEISIRGLKELTEKDILMLAEIKPRQNLLAVNTDELVRRISANNWVKKIYAGKELPNRLVLEVRERIPAALIKRGGDFYLIDGEGFIFKKLSKNDEVDLPILTGIYCNEKKKDKLLSSALNLLKDLSSSSNYNYLGTISEVHIDKVFGLSLLTSAGFHLKLGIDDYQNKLNKLSVVVADLEKRGLKTGYISVDLCDAEKVTIQRKNAIGRTEPGKKGKQYRT